MRGLPRLDAAPGTLGKKNLTTMHAVAQALAIGPMFSVALILGGVSRPDIGAGWNAALAVLLAGLGVLAIAYHFANGLHTAMMGWGIAETKTSLRRSQTLSWVVFIVMLVMGWGAVFALFQAGKMT